jgi:hypothetical protein
MSVKFFSSTKKRILRALNRRIIGAGPYRVASRRLADATDIDWAAAVVEAECFRTALIPQPLPIATLNSLLVIAPRADDEIIGAVGALLLAKEAGAQLHIAYVTDGAQDPTVYGHDIVQRRSLEASRVCKRLGATLHQVGISNISMAVEGADVERLADIVVKTKPDAGTWISRP